MSGLLATHTKPIGYTWHCHRMCGHTCNHKGTTVSLWKHHKTMMQLACMRCDMAVCLFGLTSSHCSCTQQLYRSVSCQAKGPELSHGTPRGPQHCGMSRPSPMDGKHGTLYDCTYHSQRSFAPDTFKCGVCVCACVCVYILKNIGLTEEAIVAPHHRCEPTRADCQQYHLQSYRDAVHIVWCHNAHQCE